MQAEASLGRRARGSGVSRQRAVAGAVLLGAVAFAFVLARTDTVLAPLWILGMVGGFTLQRSRFCFASAFRDLFLFGSSRTMKGVFMGLGVATTGFAIVMYKAVPFPAFGSLPPEAHILPVGLSVVVGGLLFGFGMVLSGGCVSGSLYRMAEGYVGSWVSIAGVIIGLAALSHTWNWWWRVLVSHEPRVWLPSTLSLGYGGGVAVTLAGILAVYLLVTWWESRAGRTGGKEPGDGAGCAWGRLPLPDDEGGAGHEEAQGGRGGGGHHRSRPVPGDHSAPGP